MQAISFSLVGILIASSIRGFLQIWLKIFQAQNATYSVHYSNMLVLFMAWMMEQQHAAAQQQAAMQQPGAQPQACTTPAQPVMHAPPPSAPATPQQVTPGQSTPVAAPTTSLLDLAEDLARVTTGPFRARRDSRSRSQQEPYQPEKPPVRKAPVQPAPAQPASAEQYQFGGISSDDEDE